MDTSALYTLLEDEPGADRVEELLRGERVLIPDIALIEVVYVTTQESSEQEARRRYELLRQVGATVLWGMDEATLLRTAAFKATFRMSLADCMIAAHADRHGAVLVHKDPEYEAVANVVLLEALPYRSGSENANEAAAHAEGDDSRRG